MEICPVCGRMCVFVTPITRNCARKLRKFLAPPCYSQRAVFASLSLSAFFSLCYCTSNVLACSARYCYSISDHLHQTGFVGKGSDHLQLIKFWQSRRRPPGRGSAAGRIFLAPPYYSSVCVSLSAVYIMLLRVECASMQCAILL